LQRAAKKIHQPASTTPGSGISRSNNEMLEENAMTKLLSAAAAFVLFAPIATAILLQAAQIVA
jgi:hypothetical protein